MAGKSIWSALACAGIVALAPGCRQPDGPPKPAKPIPAGAVRIHFTKKVTGPLEVTLDGMRIPVAPSKKKFQNVLISGLKPGRHTYFLSSPQDAFGPDQGTWDVFPDRGTYAVLLVQNYKAVIYGKLDPLPPAEGIPGVKVQLEP